MPYSQPFYYRKKKKGWMFKSMYTQSKFHTVHFIHFYVLSFFAITSVPLREEGLGSYDYRFKLQEGKPAPKLVIMWVSK